MSGELHQISVAIGELRVEVRNLTTKQSELATDMNARLNNIETKVTSDAASFDALKNKGWGLITGVTVLAGALGSFLATQGKSWLEFFHNS